MPLQCNCFMVHFKLGRDGGDIVLGICKIDVPGQTGAAVDVWLLSLAL